MCLWIQVQPPMDSRVEEFNYVDSNSNHYFRARLVERRLQDDSTESKITRFRSILAEKSNKEI